MKISSSDSSETKKYEREGERRRDREKVFSPPASSSQHSAWNFPEEQRRGKDMTIAASIKGIKGGNLNKFMPTDNLEDIEKLLENVNYSTLGNRSRNAESVSIC